jgi:lipopolysaccharide export system permease protein
MKIPITLALYIAKQFLIWFASAFGLLLVLIYLGDLVELIGRAAVRPEVTLPTLMHLAALKLPYTAQEVMPFGVLLGAILALWRMTRNQELIVARAAGISVWQFLAPAVILAFAIGTVGVTVFNPLASSFEATYKQIDAKLLHGQTDAMLLTNSAIWLRQSDGEGNQAVVHAVRRQQPDMSLSTVTILFFREDDRIFRRLDAAQATLGPGAWTLKDVLEWRPERDVARHFDEVSVPTDLTARRIEDSFAPPETMSFWALPNFIALLEASGFSPNKHRLYYDSLLARPFLLCAMVLIAALFSLRMQRRGGTTGMIIGGVASGFAFYFLSKIMFALGASQTIPVVLAAWTPTGIAMLLGTSGLLHMEDG